MKPKSVERIKAEKYVAKNPKVTAGELVQKCGVALATAYKVLEEASRSSSLSDMVREVSNGKAKLRMSDNPAVIQGFTGKQYELMDTSPSPFGQTPMATYGETINATVEQVADAVNHPSHYKTGGIEVIDFIEAKGFNYRIGNVVKYVSRASHKGNYIQDLEKAMWYLEREISKARNES
jgi:hypothetical protein